ncbi:unnamed protein product [Strongylus vulgaris]|uniref:Uncharacterized protein n=1 Tax=Strongylus vulgaris TaxID=40348 RepID=A0A3P7IKP3_STRVU|nr:unnamed protein product [Strongylus vulgaris]
MPEWVAKLIPQWLNHVTHTLPVLYVGFDLLTVRRSPPPHGKSLQMAGLHVLVYFLIIMAVRFFDGYWLYPLLEILPWEAFIGTFVVSILGYYALIRIAVFFSSCIHGESTQDLIDCSNSLAMGGAASPRRSHDAGDSRCPNHSPLL